LGANLTGHGGGTWKGGIPPPCQKRKKNGKTRGGRRMAGEPAPGGTHSPKNKPQVGGGPKIRGGGQSGATGGHSGGLGRPKGGNHCFSRGHCQGGRKKATQERGFFSPRARFSEKPCRAAIENEKWFVGESHLGRCPNGGKKRFLGCLNPSKKKTICFCPGGGGRAWGPRSGGGGGKHFNAL